MLLFLLHMVDENTEQHAGKLTWSKQAAKLACFKHAFNFKQSMFQSTLLKLSVFQNTLKSLTIFGKAGDFAVIT